METYPAELLVGVFPLIFCVDATKNGDETKAAATSSGRGAFDKFLDAMAASLMEEPVPDQSPKRTSNNNIFRVGSHDQDYDSDADDMILNNTALEDDDTFGTALQQGQSFFQRARIVSISTRYGFPPSKDPQGSKNRMREIVEDYATIHNHNNNNNRSSMNSNASAGQQHATHLSPTKLLKSLQQRPIDGILPSGWLEKHAAALPSVILIVLQLEQGNEISRKKQQQQTLEETLQNLHYSLAPKRNMKIHVVGLVQQGISQIATEQWYESMQETLRTWQQSNRNQNLVELSLVPTEDLQPDAVYHGSALQQLHELVRTASLQYYQHQSKHVKEKLWMLGAQRTLPALLPLSIRYCFQTAVFYEFQWRQDKSLKYMVEAHRLLEAYYRYLLQVGVGGGDDETAIPSASNPQQPDEAMPRISSGGEGGESVELSIGGSAPPDFAVLLQSIRPAQDMMYQCRTVADWIHFKILQSCLVSNTQGSLVAASQQWQHHAQSFCCPRRSFSVGDDSATNTAWLDWSYVARQHVVLGQLLERYPPRALMGNTNDPAPSTFDEVLLRLSPWKSYHGAAEAYLNVAYYLKQFHGKFGKEQESDARTKYVGGIDHEGLEPLFQEERKVNHHEEALQCATRAIGLFNKELGSVTGTSTRRSVARLQYLAGGILMGMSRPLEALPYLEEASGTCKGWRGLELAISRLLVQCYGSIDKYPSDKTDPNLSSRMLVSHFKAQISEDAFRTALGKIGALAGEGQNETISWTVPISDGDKADAPLAFSVTFPEGSHSTAGDTVSASIWIQSKVEFPIEISSVTVLTVAGPVVVPTKDLLAAKNANQASAESITIQGHGEVQVITNIDLPTDLEVVAESGAADAKSALVKKTSRPRTSGLTAGAGARFVVRDDVVDSSERVRKSLWSSECLGGKAIQCSGLEVVFSMAGSGTKVQCTLEKQSSRTEESVKRTPFEEENYLSAAWERPNLLPMKFGPCCLRVLPPMPTMTVTDVTSSLTNGVALEGTINRIILQLTAPHSDEYSDITVQARCSSRLLSDQDSNDKQEDILSRNQPDPWSPVLVMIDKNSKAAKTSAGYKVPDGWTPVNKDSESGATIASTSLKPGLSTYTFFDIYRPVGLGANSAEEAGSSLKQCFTDVNVSVSYRQENDNVSLDYTVSLVWKPAVDATFASENVEESESSNRVLIGTKATTASCIFQAAAASDGLDISIDQVEFIAPDSDKPPDSKRMESPVNSVVYKNENGDTADALGQDSSLSVAWPCENPNGHGTSITSRLLSVQWSPVPLDIPQEVLVGVKGIDGVTTHGPLALSTPTLCYIKIPAADNNEAPFDVNLCRAPDSLQVGVPFELSYTVVNRTSMDQELDIKHDHEGTAILMGGQTNTSISLAPFETYSLSFMIVPMKVGQIEIAHLSVWSARYQTWVVKNGSDNHLQYCVMP